MEAQSIASCAKIPVASARAGLERSRKADIPLVYKVGPDTYSPTFTTRKYARAPEDCQQDAPPSDTKTGNDHRTISEKYLDLALLQCIGCVVYRNRGDIPRTFFRATMFAKCQTADLSQTSSALRRLAAWPQAPIIPITPSEHQKVYQLTDIAKAYMTMPPDHCDTVLGFTKKQAAQPQPPQSVTLEKNVAAQLRARRKNRDKSVANCLQCIAQRHPDDHKDLVVPANGIRRCVGLSRPAATESLLRLASGPQAPVALVQGEYRQFALTKHAYSLDIANPPQSCQNIAPATLKSLPESMAEAYAESVTQDEAMRQKIITRLQQLLVEQVIDITAVTKTSSSPGFSYTYGKHQCQFTIGNTLRAESPGLRQAFLYTFGLDALIYGKPLDAAALKEELQLRPLDSIKALGHLVAYKMRYQKPPFEYTDIEKDS
ncbi:MAG TPA: hypothetical protein VJ843_02810 [Candidatus Saccharimonadales bacterium]|nr:hypothetical protein [Candidatus Saccharimonadales bacterium]